MQIPPQISKLQIQTHGACNANCAFCPYIESWHRKNYGVMSEELFIKILDGMFWAKRFISSEQGKVCPYLMQEPLADKRIFRFIDLIYERFPSTEVEISTNGRLLSEDYADKLIDKVHNKRHRIWFSFHGINKTTFEDIMKIDFEKTLKNVVNFLKKAEKLNLNVVIRGSGKPQNKGKKWFETEEYFQFWKRIGEENNLDIRNFDIGTFDYHDRAGTIYRSERNASDNRNGIIRKIDKDNPFYCPRLDKWLHVMWNGDIRLCCQDYHKEIELPNLNDMSPLQYFTSDEYKNIFGKHCGEIESEENFICKRCLEPGSPNWKPLRN